MAPHLFSGDDIPAQIRQKKVLRIVPGVVSEYMMLQNDHAIATRYSLSICICITLSFMLDPIDDLLFGYHISLLLVKGTWKELFEKDETLLSETVLLFNARTMSMVEIWYIISL